MTRVLVVLPGRLRLHYRSHLDALRTRGVLVMSGESPSAAAALTEVCRPDIVVVGLSMPEMEGLEVVTLLRQRSGLTVPIVVLPDPEDPLDPLICTCERVAGTFAVDPCPRDQIWARIAELCGLAVEAAAARLEEASSVAN